MYEEGRCFWFWDEGLYLLLVRGIFLLRAFNILRDLRVFQREKAWAG